MTSSASSVPPRVSLWVWRRTCWAAAAPCCASASKGDSGADSLSSLRPASRSGAAQKRSTAPAVTARAQLAQRASEDQIPAGDRHQQQDQRDAADDGVGLRPQMGEAEGLWTVHVQFPWSLKTMGTSTQASTATSPRRAGTKRQRATASCAARSRRSEPELVRSSTRARLAFGRYQHAQHHLALFAQPARQHGIGRARVVEVGGVEARSGHRGGGGRGRCGRRLRGRAVPARQARVRAPRPRAR